MIKNSDYYINEAPDKKKLLAFDFFWLGFILYILSFTLSQTGEIKYLITDLIQILGLVILVPSAAFLIAPNLESNYLKINLFLYFICVSFIIIRGFRFDYQFFKQMLLSVHLGIFLFLVPLVLLFPSNLIYLRKTFNVILIFSIAYLIYDLIFFKHLINPYNTGRSQAIMEYFSQHLSLPGGFLLLSFLYHAKKKNLIILFTLVVTFLLSVIRARRGLMFMSFSMLIFAYFIYQYANKSKVINVVLSTSLLVIFSFGAVFVYSKNRNDTFELITERIGQDTRSQVEEYFFRDMNTKDWIIGKGINGQYFCPGVNEGAGRISIYRTVIETGYLQVILNGGLIHLALDRKSVV